MKKSKRTNALKRNKFNIAKYSIVNQNKIEKEPHTNTNKINT